MKCKKKGESVLSEIEYYRFNSEESLDINDRVPGVIFGREKKVTTRVKAAQYEGVET